MYATAAAAQYTFQAQKSRDTQNLFKQHSHTTTQPAREEREKKKKHTHTLAEDYLEGNTDKMKFKLMKLQSPTFSFFLHVESTRIST